MKILLESIQLERGYFILFTYIRYEHAGDQYVGRTVVGLTITQRILFAATFFKNRGELVNIIIAVFSKSSKQFTKGCRIFLGISIIPKEFRLSTLPTTQPLFFTSLFRNRGRLEELYGLIE